MTAEQPERTITFDDLRICCEGVIPPVVATASVDGTPNITYLSCAHMVDEGRVALSNQFFSKTARNLVENPRASVLVIDPTTYDQYRLTLVYERTDRRGPVFERLREDVDISAARHRMQDVFKLRAADIYRVVDIEVVESAVPSPARTSGGQATVDSAAAAQLAIRLGRCPDLDTLVEATMSGLSELLHYDHALLLLLDEDGARLYTIASHGYDTEGVGSEVTVGDGIIGMVAARATPITRGNLRQDAKYSRTVRRSFEDTGALGPGHEIPVPGLASPASTVAVPAMALGEVVGVLAVESDAPVAYGPADEALLTMVAGIVANAIEVERARERAAEVVAPGPAAAPPTAADEQPVHVRFFPGDGSTFIDGDYLIKGVAGRLLWSLLGQYERERRVDFTNREVRLDPALELPEFRDNFESRLILLKRRLEERAAPLRIDKTGRGRFRLGVERPLRLETGG
jgi:GAF domain-containing protein